MILRIDNDMARLIARSEFFDRMTDEEKNHPTLLQRLLVMKRQIRKILGEPKVGEYTGDKTHGATLRRTYAFRLF